MSKNKSNISKTSGLPPGTIVYTGDEQPSSCKIDLIQFNEEKYERFEAYTWNEIKDKLKDDAVNWIDIDNLNNIALIEEIGNHFNFHYLIMEDIVAVDLLPKIEDYDDYLLFSLKMLELNAKDGQIDIEHISFVLGKNYLISFQEIPGDVFNTIRDRIFNNKGRVRKKQADYLMLVLIDVIVDNYYLILDNLQSNIQVLEEELLSKKSLHSERRILNFRKQLVTIRKNIFPLRDTLRQLIRDESEVVDVNTIKYFRDVYDHVNYVIETSEGFRDNISGLMDLYNSNLNNKLNNIIKVLTIISSIFIPLSFIAGIYGMNFDYMPELRWQYGYPTVLTIMMVLGFGMLIFMIRKKWI